MERCEFPSKALVAAFAVLAFVGGIRSAAGQATFAPADTPVPVVTGYSGVSGSAEPGKRDLAPTIAPIVLVPFGNRLLFEGEAEFEGSYERAESTWSHEWEKGIEYAQLDWVMNRGVTVVAGRFLTPFGIFNERLHSGWIRNLPDAPIVTAMELTSANGGMVRGGVALSSTVTLSYSAFGSASSDRAWFEASKATGARAGVLLPNSRLELGGSFQRQFEADGTRDDQYGLDMTWQSNRWPLDVRGEFVSNAERGDGYWLEGAYRLRRLQFARVLMRKSQVVFRAEQFFAPSGELMLDVEEAGHGGALPQQDTRRFTAGWNYWFTPSVRCSASFARSLSDELNQNVWSFGLTYRFAAAVAGRSR